jgi:hypothetical protein
LVNGCSIDIGIDLGKGLPGLFFGGGGGCVSCGLRGGGAARGGGVAGVVAGVVVASGDDMFVRHNARFPPRNRCKSLKLSGIGWFPAFPGVVTLSHIIYIRALRNMTIFFLY